MIVSADGYQPRAATLTVDEQPVELALLLPRSAAVARHGALRGRARSATPGSPSGRTTTSSTRPSRRGDGRYRFDDLAEGTYTVAASAQPGRAVARLSLAEGADLDVDLDLVGPDGAR